MSDTSEVGVAAVRIIPVLKGFSAEIKKQLGSEMSKAAKKAGDDAGSDLAKGIVKAAKKAGSEAGDDFASAVKSWPAPKWPDWPPPQVAQTMESEFREVREAARKTMAEVAKQLRVDGRVTIDTREIEMAKAALRDLNSIPAPSVDIKVDASAAKKAGDDAGDAIADGIEDGVDSGSGRLRGAADRVGDIFKKGLAAAGIAAGAALAVGLSSALDVEVATDRLAAQLRLTGEEAERVADLSSDIFAGAWGDSIGEVSDALRGVITEMGSLGKTSDAELTTMTTQAIDLASVFGTDVNEVIRTAGALMSNDLAANGEEALDLIAVGLQQAGIRGDDFLEVISEYSNQFSSIGISADYALSLMGAGLGAGARNTDVLADSIKEMWITVSQGEPAATQALTDLGFSVDDVAAAFADGGDAANLAMQDVLTAILGVEDENERIRLGTALMGTTFEQVGDDVLAAMARAEPGLEDLGTAADDVSAIVNDNLSTSIEAFKRGALQKLTDFINDTAIPAVQDLAAFLGPPLREAAEKLSEFWATLTTGVAGDEASGVEAFALGLRDAFSWVPGVVDDLTLFWNALTTGMTEDEGTAIETVALAIRDFGDYLSENQELIIGALVGLGVAVGVAAVALAAMAVSSVAAAAPFILLAAGAAALGAGLVWLYTNVEGFRTVVETALPIIQDIFTTTMAVIGAIVAVTVAQIQWIWANWGTQIVAIATAAWEMVSGVIIGALNVIAGVVNLVLALIEGDWSAAWDAVKQIASGAWQIIWSTISNGLKLIYNTVVIWMGMVTAFWGSVLGGLVNTARSKLDAVIAFFRSLPGRVSSAFSSLASAMTSPFASAFSAIRGLWNRTVGGFGFSMPSWVPGIGGKSFRIPRMHTGGIVPGPIGSEQLILAQAGETVFTPDQMAAINSAPRVAAPAAAQSLDVNVIGGDRDLVRLVQKWVRNNAGGDAQLGLGTRRSTRTA